MRLGTKLQSFRSETKGFHPSPRILIPVGPHETATIEVDAYLTNDTLKRGERGPGTRGQPSKIAQVARFLTGVLVNICTIRSER